MPQQPTRSTRLEARISPDVLAVVKRAAEIQGRSVSDFVVAAAREAAQRTIEETQIIRLSVDGISATLAESVLNPPQTRSGPAPRPRIASSPDHEIAVTDSFVIEPLASNTRSPGISCGANALDRYLHTQAGQDMRRRISNCFVAVPSGSRIIAGYYTLSAASIPLTELPPEDTKRLPRYPVLPAALVGRLAVDEQYRRNHWVRLYCSMPSSARRVPSLPCCSDCGMQRMRMPPRSTAISNSVVSSVGQ